jgi:hypothetical protein
VVGGPRCKRGPKSYGATVFDKSSSRAAVGVAQAAVGRPSWRWVCQPRLAPLCSGIWRRSSYPVVTGVVAGGMFYPHGRGQPVVDTPKSSAGVRTIAMPQALVDLLAEHLARRGLTAADADRLLFEAPQGGPLRYANWRCRVWLPAAVAAHCEGAGFHDLRRVSATALVVGGVNVRTAQRSASTPRWSKKPTDRRPTRWDRRSFPIVCAMKARWTVARREAARAETPADLALYEWR